MHVQNVIECGVPKEESGKIEQIEEEHDRKAFEEYEKDKAEGKSKTYSHEEVWAEIGL